MESRWSRGDVPLGWFPVAMCVVAAAYQAVALIAAWTRRRPRRLAMGPAPSVSILKPVRGAEPGLYEALRSNVEQEYPGFEILSGVSNPADPALDVIERLMREFPQARLRLLFAKPATPNAKAGMLDELARHASGEVVVIADADILVPAGYLRRVVAPLSDEAVGLVTCAYRARSETWAGRFEALGVATDFAPSAMTAAMLGAAEFGLGSTLAVRRRDLDRIGGIAKIAEYLADDYQLAREIHALGLKCVLSDVVVETRLSGASWSETWRHQVRWARTIRVSRGGGYAGLPLTHATTWAFVAALSGSWPAALALMTIRYAMAFTAGWVVLRSADALRLWWLIPARDLYGTAVWAAGMFGSTVEWGGETLRLKRDGRIVR